MKYWVICDDYEPAEYELAATNREEAVAMILAMVRAGDLRTNTIAVTEGERFVVDLREAQAERKVEVEKQQEARRAAFDLAEYRRLAKIYGGQEMP